MKAKSLVFFGLCVLLVNAATARPPAVGEEEEAGAIDKAAAAAARKPAPAAPKAHADAAMAAAAVDKPAPVSLASKPKLNEPPPPQPAAAAGVGEPRPTRRSPWPQRRLADHPACAAAVRHLCSRSIMDNNFAVLDCLQRDQAVAERVPADCQHAVWRLKFNLTHNVKFELAANGACQSELQALPDCRDLQPGRGQRVSCLVEHKRQIRSPDCLAFLTRLEPIVFSDYRMVRPFAAACLEDIKRLKCGRIGTGPSSEQEDTEAGLPQTQGLTVACLSRRVADLEGGCKRQLLRLAELQSDDFHNDRQLFYACREDRERLCASVPAGDGRVFSCLGRQSPSALSGKCKAELKRVHSLMQYDYRVEHRFAQACKADLERHECTPAEAGDTQEHGMVRALLCLENAVITKGPETVDTECQRQMLKVRTEYLSEPELEPELQKKCAAQVAECRKEGSDDQQLLHCIMGLVQSSKDPDSVSDCKAAIARLLRVAMPTRDLQVDPVLTASCRSELDSRCADSKQHKNGYVCLKSLLANEPDAVGRDCGDRLAELEYFENRDFKLNDRLYKACRQPAVSLCNASKDWFQTDRDQGYQPAAAVYNCLFHHVHVKADNSVPPGCIKELLHSLEERADRVKLDPRLYRPCITDLSTKCMARSGTGQEFRCLQDKLDELSVSCKAAVRELTIAESQDIRLSPDVIMVRSCMPFVQAHCNLKQDTVNDDSVMECLIRFKKHADMPEKCRAGVEHHQLVALKDVKFSHAFSEACREAITVRCPGVATKVDAVRCLSAIVRNDTLTDAKQRVPQQCRSKLTLEMLQRAQSVALDPRLQAACAVDLQNLCRDAEQPLTCLKDHAPELQTKCKQVVFRRQKMQMEMPTYDAKLMKRCETMIHRYCKDKLSSPTDIFTCLRSSMHDEEFDRRCRRIVYKRLKVQQTNYELNPDLRRACKPDVARYCSKELAASGASRFQSTQDQLQDTVMQCLRRASDEGKPLRQKCHRFLRDMQFEYNVNYRLDPVLSRACKPVVEQLCHEEVAAVGPDASNLLGVTECLKRAAAENRIPKEATECRREVLRLFKEMRADIHVDPVLYQACSFEIRNLCRGVPLGNGRQMSCALSLFRDSQANQMMSMRCRDALKERVDLMESAFKAAPPESLREVMGQMSASPSRLYFLLIGVLLVLCGMLLVFGPWPASAHVASNVNSPHGGPLQACPQLDVMVKLSASPARL